MAFQQVVGVLLLALGLVAAAGRAVAVAVAAADAAGRTSDEAIDQVEHAVDEVQENQKVQVHPAASVRLVVDVRKPVEPLQLDFAALGPEPELELGGASAVASP